MEPAQKSAREILAIIEATYQATHDYQLVSASAFKHLDLAFYERTTALFVKQGFRVLADVEDKTITNTPGTVLMPVMVRALISKDGTVMCSLYHPRIGPLIPRLLLWVLRKLPGKVVDMETEFSDGSFVATSNATGAAAMELPALISAEYLPMNTTPFAVQQRHTQRVTEHLAQRPGVTARVITTHTELLASQNRMNALKAAHRGEIGGVTRDELDKLSIFGPKLAGDVHTEIVREQLRRAS